MREKAKLLVSQDRMREALQILEPMDIDANTLDFDVEDPHYCAKNLLLATNWMQASGQRQGKKVIERYQAVIHYDPTWEKGYFFLAKYYEYLLSVSHPVALNGSMSNDSTELVIDSVFHAHLINLMKNYVLALSYGTKFVFQSLPRLLTLWFEYGEVLYASAISGRTSSKTNKALRQIEIGLSQSTTEQKILDDIDKIVNEAADSLPAYEWLMCFPQVTSRICHPNPVVVEGVKKIMIRVLLAYPTQAMWPLLGLSRSLNSQRRNRAREIISITQKEFVSQGLKEIAESFTEGMRMAEELISLAGHDPGNSQRKIHIRLSRIRTRILVPIQAALTTILPASGKAPRDESHVAFSANAQIYIKAFSDKADVMMTKEKPKRIEVLGTDGHLYPFLCKREKTGDLRKDARMMEFNSMINKLLQKDQEGRKRKLRLRTYAVVVLNEENGLMEWVRHTKAMRQLIGQIHKTERGYIQPIRMTHDIKERYLNMQKKYANDPPAMARYYRRKVLSMPVFTPRFHQWFYNNFADPTAWFEARLTFSRSAAVWSMVGHIIGLGDRHGENILIDCTNGECVHVDFDCLFDKGLKLAKPEIVPFRLTPNIIDAFGITGYEGVFRRVSEVTMHLLRENKETLRSVLESFIHDPLVEWGRRGKATQGSGKSIPDLPSERTKEETRLVLNTIDDRLRGIYNLGDAIRPLVARPSRQAHPRGHVAGKPRADVHRLDAVPVEHFNPPKTSCPPSGMEVIAVGTAAIDVVHEVAAYPEEDTKARSLATRKCRGGNAATAMVVCSQLGGRCRWLSTSMDPAKDSDAAFIHADLASFNVDCSLAVIETEGSMPVSYILSSRATGSRTIVHSRTITELDVESFKKQVERYLTDISQDMNAPVWFHFEGRNMETVRQMMLHLRENVPQAKISVEIEFPRYPWTLAKTLASLADFVFMSKDYLRDNINIGSAQEFFEMIRNQQWDEDWNQWVKAFICPWGSEGVYYLEMSGTAMHHIPAAQLDRVVESNGAGDSFIGASLAGLSRGNVPLELVIKTACDVATVKCSQHGFKLPDEMILKWQQDLQLENSGEIDDEVLDSRITDTEQTPHSVTSEVEVELELVSQTDEGSGHLFAVPLLSALVEDDDGDIVVPRKQARKRMKSEQHVDSGDEAANKVNTTKTNNLRSTDAVFVLEARSRTTWDTAGTQLWRAALLLAEYIYNSPELFAGQTVLELGCGIGFTSIVASRMSRCVYGTDCDESALRLATRNAKRNSHGDLRFRLLDWNNVNAISTIGATPSSTYGWTPSDQAELESLTTIIASDVFYDDSTTILFLRALRRLMVQYNRAKAYVSLERRSVFSAVAMRVVSLGYDAFQDHICSHEPSTCHMRICENQIRCRACGAATPGNKEEEFLRFVVHDIDINGFPQRFKYDRLSSLMLWVIDAVVIP
ncbi:Serine/threonine-protein kinase [Phytophthora fragariae]|uniref:Serine/threonine-protein kinase ATR n=1 Tax=Phytophthora fragariae TaxID=53985 RepID=A0A6A3LQ99_9STRA|nr:Serine/threonine-protein kinase [Phytophthora fragariae]